MLTDERLFEVSGKTEHGTHLRFSSMCSGLANAGLGVNHNRFCGQAKGEYMWLALEVGRKYSRADVRELLGLERDSKGGILDTGIARIEDQFVIFANVGIPGKTGHDYPNRWEGNRFRWHHKNNSHLGWPSVKRLLEEENVIHVFWRDCDGQDFEYAGTGKPIHVKDVTPVEILFEFERSAS